MAEMIDRLAKKPLGKRGFTESALVSGWPAIVGEMLGQNTLPLKIVFPVGERTGGTLHIRVASGALAIELQHLQPLILQRINGHFGYGAVVRLQMVQGPLPPRSRRRVLVPPKLSPAAEQALTDQVARVSDPDLREALARLGRHLAPKD